MGTYYAGVWRGFDSCLWTQVSMSSWWPWKAGCPMPLQDDKIEHEWCWYVKQHFVLEIDLNICYQVTSYVRKLASCSRLELMLFSQPWSGTMKLRPWWFHHGPAKLGVSHCCSQSCWVRPSKEHATRYSETRVGTASEPRGYGDVFQD